MVRILSGSRCNKSASLEFQEAAGGDVVVVYRFVSDITVERVGGAYGLLLTDSKAAVDEETGKKS